MLKLQQTINVSKGRFLAKYNYSSKNRLKVTYTYNTDKIVHQAPILWDGQRCWLSESFLTWPLDASKLTCKDKQKNINQYLKKLLSR